MVLSRGFTLLELMITIALLAIILGLAVPSFTTLVQNNRATAQANDLISFLQLARSEALKTNQPMSICPANVTAETLTCANNWSEGWMVYRDGQAAGSDSSSVDEVIRASRPPLGGLSLAWNGGEQFLRYLPDGRIDPVSMPDSQGNGGTPPALRFILETAGCRGDNARRIVIERTGRLSTRRIECQT